MEKTDRWPTRGSKPWIAFTMMSPARKDMTAKEFAKLLANSGLSQIEAAIKIGVHKQTIHRWLKGTRGIDVFKAEAIRAALK
jgi:transposase